MNTHGANATSSGDSASSSGPSIGVASMETTGDVVLQLRASLDGGDNFGEGYFRYAYGSPEYDSILRHLGGLKPGESKPVPPWPDTDVPDP